MNSELPPLRDVIAEHGLFAKKGLGQHFLLDLNITRKIARLTGASSDDVILEVGPGPGGLTRALLETGADVIAIEKDRRIAEVLAPLSDVYGAKFTLTEADALTINEAAMTEGRNVVLASNLPYNISTELLVKWLLASPRWWTRLVLMFQREVGDRILAAPGSKTYGRLSVMAQAASQPSLGFHLPARAFTPPPKVASSVLVFDDCDHDALTLKALERVTAAAFAQRRKMIRTTLKPVFGEDMEQVFEALGLEPTQRAETISVKTFLDLAEAFRQRTGGEVS